MVLPYFQNLARDADQTELGAYSRHAAALIFNGHKKPIE